ncbi:MAG TPA: hypothetical protein VF210_16075 [Pseudomonadales bacterium]
MRTLSNTLLAIALLGAAGTAAANTVVTRGYDTCIDDLEASYPRHAKLVHSPYYYHAVSADNMSYFVNSSAWQDGDRVGLKTLCTTDRFGRRVLLRETELGRWIPDRGVVRVEEVTSR